MVFVEPSTRVAKDFKCEVVNDVLYTFVRDRRAFRPVKKKAILASINKATAETDLFMEISNRPRNWRSEV